MKDALPVVNQAKKDFEPRQGIFHHYLTGSFFTSPH